MASHLQPVAWVPCRGTVPKVRGPPVLESREHQDRAGMPGGRGGDWAGKPVWQLGSQFRPLTSWACTAGVGAGTAARQGRELGPRGHHQVRRTPGWGERQAGTPHAWPPTLTEPQLSPPQFPLLLASPVLPPLPTASFPHFCFRCFTF